jgi:hypothetical protein
MAIVGEAYVVVRAVTTGFENDVKKSLSGMNKDFDALGKSAGSTFGRSLSSSGASKSLSQLSKQAYAAKEAFASMVTTGYFVGPALSAIVGAVGSLAAGLVALVSQISAALPALVVLPSVFSAFGQAAATAKLAFSGLGKAIGALGKQTTGGGGVSRMPSLLQAMASAQERVHNATRNLERSQKALNEAYRTASERIQQLNFDTEDAALSEQRAAIALEEARRELALVQDLPPNNSIRREAELAYAEADLNYRRAKDRTNDLVEEQDKVTKNGTLSATEQVEQSDEVIAAKEAEAQAIIELKKAIDEQIKAQKELFSGGGGGGGAAANPLEGLSAEAASFAQFIVGLKPKINELKAAAGKELFPQLEDAIQNLADNLFPALIPILEDTGKALGGAAKDFSNIFTEADNLKNINTVAKTNTDTIGKLGVVAGNLSTTFFDILAAADPLIRRFTDWVVTLTEGWKKSALLNNEGGRLTTIFNQAGDTMAQLGRIFGNIGRALMDVGRAAAGPGSGGQMLLDSFEGATKKFEEFVTKISESGQLAQYFRDIVPNVEAIGRFLANIVEEVLKLGDNKSIAGFADSLTSATDFVGDMFDRLMGASPALGDFISKIAEFLMLFSESNSMNTFFAILNLVLDVLTTIFGNPMIQQVLLFLAPIMGAVKAFRLLNKGVQFSRLVVKGYMDAGKKAFNTIKTLAQKTARGQLLDGARLRLMYAKDAAMKGLAAAKVGLIAAKTKIASAATKVWTGLQAAFNAVMAMNPITLIIIAIVALIAIVVVLYFRFKWMRDFVQMVWEGIQAAADAVWRAIRAGVEFLWNNVIRPIWNAILSVFQVIWGAIVIYFTTYWNIITGAITFAWENIIRPAFTAMLDVFSFVWNLIAGVFTTIWNGIVGAVQFGIGIITGIVNGLIDVFTAVFDTIADIVGGVFDGVGDIITGVINGILAGIEEGLNLMIDMLNTVLDGIDRAAGPWVNFGEIPDVSLPRLASGGVVRRPTIAMIGEGGRPERVEPLDKDGLSQRDKAIIKILAGGTGGAINVYPSPGMNEIELAQAVLRKSTALIRKGGM